MASKAYVFNPFESCMLRSGDVSAVREFFRQSVPGLQDRVGRTPGGRGDTQEPLTEICTPVHGPGLTATYEEI